MSAYKNLYLETYDAVKNNDKAALAALVSKKETASVVNIRDRALRGDVEGVNNALSNLFSYASPRREGLLHDEEFVRSMAKITEAVHAALEGYAQAGNQDQVQQVVDKYTFKERTPLQKRIDKEAFLARSRQVNTNSIFINEEIIAFGYGKGGHTNALANGVFSNFYIDAALLGYIAGGFPNAAKAALRKKGADKNAALYGNAIQGNVQEVNELIAKGANKDIAVFAYACKGFKEEAKKLIKQGASIDMAIAGFRINGDGEEVRLQQFAKQTQARNRRTILVILAAIFLTPLSLFFTIPLWRRAKENEPLIAVPLTKVQNQIVSKKRKAFGFDHEKGRGPDKNAVDPNKPKKAWLDEKTCIFDKPQWERYSFFADTTLEKLQEDKDAILVTVARGKEESKRVVWGKC